MMITRQTFSIHQSLINIMNIFTVMLPMLKISSYTNNQFNPATHVRVISYYKGKLEEIVQIIEMFI